MTSKTNKEGYAKACHLDAKMSVLAYPFLTIASRQNYITSLRGERYKTFMNKTIIDDGFNAELVTNAFFDGIMEIPILEKPKEIIIPPALIPFTQIKRSDTKSEAVHFYEHDKRFFDVLTCTKELLPELAKFSAVISPDCSLYRDMPLCLQIVNTYMNRAVGLYLQSNGLYVIPNVRWGDERSFTTVELPDKFAFLGIPKNSIVSIGTYGCIKSRENKDYFRRGLSAMLDELSPEVVLVYGGMPEYIFGEFKRRTQFINYPDWTSTKRRRAV